MGNQVLFVLGADDPEMRRIEQLLREWNAGEVRHATKDGRRVHPGNAYQSDMVISAWQGQIVLIECQPASLPKGAEVIRIDHHQPGDPGYGLPPKDYFRASSIGQLWIMMFPNFYQDNYPPQDVWVLAAMDHCPANAIRGECPGVTAAEVI